MIRPLSITKFKRKGRFVTKTNKYAWSAALLASMLIANPAHAQIETIDPATQLMPDSPEALEELAVLDVEVSASTTEAGALDLARRKIAVNDLSGAATVLERYLIQDQEAMLARAEYAVTLCRLDDIQAAQLEMLKLSYLAIPADTQARVTAACGPLAPPAA